MNFNHDMFVLKESNGVNQPKQRIILKYKEPLQNAQTKEYCSNRQGSSQDKQNQNFVQEKKVKLKLKTFTLKQSSSKPTLFQSSKKSKQQKINQLNSVPKIIKNHKENVNNQKTKSNKISTYFKPSVIYFSLKTSKQNKNEPKEGFQKQKQIAPKQTKLRKNYQLSAFISQFLNKINHKFFTQIENQQSEFQLNFFTYSQFMEILCSLAMIRHSSEADYKIQIEDQKEQLQKVYFLWRIFKANLISSLSSQDQNSKSFIINIIILFSAIFRIHVQNIREVNQIFNEKLNSILQKRQQSQKQDKNQLKCKQPYHIFFIKNKNLLNPQPKIINQKLAFMQLTESAKNQIFKEFQLFRINRLNSQNCLKTVKQQISNEIQTFQFDIGSLISPKSKQLAQTKRKKILEEIKNCQPQKKLFKQKLSENDLNLFLTYKSPKNCENKLIKSTQEPWFQIKKQEKFQSKQKIKKKQKNEIKSPKIKYSQLNVVINMQKARKLKEQKRIILEKGWTNSGSLNSKLPQQRQNKEGNKESSQGKNYNSWKQQTSSKKQPVNCTNVNFFERRKNSFRGMKILQQKMKNREKMQQKNEDFKDYEDLFLSQENQKDEVRRQVELLDDISNSTIPIKDNQCFDLEDGELNEGEDFIMQSPFQLQKNLKSKQLHPIKTQENTRTQAQSFEKYQSGGIQEFNFKSKTFNTEQNQFLQDDSSNSQLKTQRSSKQGRVIKSYLKIPILYVDVNMDDSKKQRIIIYEEDKPQDLAKQFGQKHKLGIQMIQRLQQMLQQQIGGILGRIDEEDDQNQETHDQIFHHS